VFPAVGLDSEAIGRELFCGPRAEVQMKEQEVDMEPFEQLLLNILREKVV